MEINTTNKTIQMRYGNEIFTHPINSIAYAMNENMDSVTFFRNNEQITTCPLSQITVDGTSLAVENVDDILCKLFT